MTVSSPGTSIEDLLHHRDFVRALAAKLARDPSAAEDLEQEAWLRALESPPRQVSSARGWFSRVLRNLAFERYRRDRRRQRREIDRDTPLTSPSPADLHEHRRLRERLADSMRGLRSEDRDAIELRCGEGLPPREISAKTGIQVEEVYSRLRRGFSSMRKDLDREYGDRRRWTMALVALVRHEEVAPVAAVPATTLSIGVVWLLAAAAVVLFVPLWIWIDWSEPNVQEELEETAGAETAALETDGIGEGRVDETPVATPDPERVDASPATPADTPITTGELLVEVFWHRPRERAGDIPILVETFHDENERSWVIHTEPDGRALLQLPAGDYTVTPGHGHPQRTRIQGSEETRMEFIAPHGRLLTVHVRRPKEGQHVPGAEVYTSWPQRPDTAYLLGHTNDAGTLILPDVSIDGWIWATSKGLGTSERLSLTTPLDRSNGQMRILLDLGDPAPPVTVTVVDSGGRPISGARVRLGVEVPPYFGGKGALRLPPSDAGGVTDERGVVRLESVQAAERFVLANAHGYVPRRVPLPAGASVLSVELPRPGRVSGTVRDPDGEVVPGAYVQYTPGDGRKGLVEAKADPNGAYRLGGLPPGKIRLIALDNALPQPLFVTTEIDIEAGAEYEWSPRLGTATGIGGRAVDAHGRPLDRWVVCYERSEDALECSELDLVTPRSTIVRDWTDEQGRFFFPYARAGEHWVWLCDSAETVMDWRENVTLGTLDLELAATADKRPTARIAGVLLNPKRIPTDLEVHVRGPLLRKARRIRVDRKTGEFFIDALNAARYRLAIWAPGYPAQEMPGHGTVELSPGELRDLGEVVMPPRPVVGATR